MSRLLLLFSRAWLWALAAAIAFLWCVDATWIHRQNYVSGLGEDPVAPSQLSPTGYAMGTRALIVPEHLADSYEWIEQTQAMLAGGPARVRTVMQENAPFGRPTHASSPYRWWLGLLAWAGHALTGQPLGIAVESAALRADPLLQLFWIVGGTILFRRRFGALSAGLFALGSVTLFPFAATFLPGSPDDYGLALICAAGSVAILLPAAVGKDHGARSRFLAAGIAGGVGVWLSAATAVPILAGVMAGGLIAACVQRRDAGGEFAGISGAAWRVWAVSGATTILAAYVVEYFPDAMGTLELRVIHPLYGVAWLGGGEILARAAEWIGRGKAPRRTADFAAVIPALAAVASLPVAMWRTGNAGVFAVDLMSFRLTRQPDGIISPNVATWLTQDGVTNAAWATLVPLALVGAAVWLLLRRTTAPAVRAALAIALGPVFVAAALAYLRLRWWEVLDALTLVLAAVATAGLHDGAQRGWRRSLWAGGVVAVGAIGITQLFPARDSAGKYIVTVPEVEQLIERDLGRWLAKRTDPDRSAIVLAPPAMTSALNYFGGLRGLASLAWENKDGLSAALRIMVSNSPEEAHELVRRRGIDLMVLPSWDPFFETYTRAASVQNGELFLPSLQQWRQPSWLRPLPYRLPRLPGFEQQSVSVFETSEGQGEVLALCRLAEYFLETGQADNAKAVGHALRRFPMDFGAAVARAQLEIALGESKEFAASIAALERRLSAGADRRLAWDLRVMLADLLARGKQVDLSRREVQRCLADADAAGVRSLMPLSLFHLMYLTKGFGLEFKDPELHGIAMDLLPSELRARL